MKKTKNVLGKTFRTIQQDSVDATLFFDKVCPEKTDMSMEEELDSLIEAKNMYGDMESDDKNLYLEKRDPYYLECAKLDRARSQECELRIRELRNILKGKMCHGKTA